ncbi:MAG TPA: BON domain-containing protein [Bryobacteraceae bacterium]|nr:BON domain-containing protein [Bryobacteraceae bacterium]
MRNKACIALLAIFALALACFAKEKTAMTDDTITDQVSIKLASDPVVKGGNLKVEVKDGVVTLSGQVEDTQQKDKAGTLAKKVKGVKQVINNINLRDSGAKR